MAEPLAATAALPARLAIRLACGMIRVMIRRRHGIRLACAAIASACAVPAPAQSEEGDIVQRRLEIMQQEIEKLRQENQAMRGEIDELRAKTDADWLTQARADEIRALVADVLADADTRASMLQNGLAAGWSEHFFLASLDGRFKLVLDGLMQVRWIYNFRDQQDRHIHGFENTRTRLTFRGHVFDDDIEYLIRGDFARSGSQAVGAGVFNLLDAWIRHSFTNEWSVRIGQFKLPFNREELVSPAHQLAVERSLVNEATQIGRSQGIELTYSDSLNRFMIAVSDGGLGNSTLGLINASNPVNSSALASDVEYAATARYERLGAGTWEQFDDFTSPRGEEFGALWGAAISAQETEFPGVSGFFGQVTTRHVGATLDLSLEWGGASGFISATHHYIDNPANGVFHITGIVAQAAVYVTSKTEVFIRGEYANLDNSSGGFRDLADLNLVTAGVNYYIDGHDLKWTTDIGFGISQIEDASGATFASDLAGWRSELTGESRPQVVFRTQFQLLF